MLPKVTLSQHILSLTDKRKADSEPDDEDRRGQVDPGNMHRACSSVPNNKTVSPRLPVYGKYQLPRASVCEDGWTALLFDEASEGNGAFAEPVSMFGVFDGHSGDACSKHCVRSLHKHLQHLLCSSLHQQAGAALDDVVDEALVQAFQKTDADIRDMPMVSNSGSTATVALVTSRSIHIAWAGDSRAVVLGGRKTLAQTIDHRADREDEQERVSAVGGRVFFNSGLRVMGILATTRAIGDHDLQPYGVVPTPEVLSIPRTEEQEFLVLASDGLWDVMSHEEVFDYAHKTLLKVQHKHAEQHVQHRVCSACQAAGVAARALALCARKQRHSRVDITVLLVNLKSPCTCAQPLGARNLSSSSLMSKATAALVRPRGILGSNSAGQLDRVCSGSKQPSRQGSGGQQQQQQQQATSSDSLRTASQALRTSSRSLSQLDMPQQLSDSGGLCSGFGGALVLQPSVCPGASGAARQQQIAAAAGDTGQVSDLVMSSPFASTLGRRSSTPASGVLPAVAASGKARISLASNTGIARSGIARSSSGPGSASASVSSGGGTSIAEDLLMEAAIAARPVVSAPADLRDGLIAGTLHQSLSLALGSNRSCGLLNTGSHGSAELVC